MDGYEDDLENNAMEDGSKDDEMEDDVMMSSAQTQGERVVCTGKAMQDGSKKKRGRGPTKGIKVTEPMHLEYNNLGQPCGRWRGKYGTQVGLCMRKLSILHSWSEVPEGLKKALWEDTVVSIYVLFVVLYLIFFKLYAY